MRAYVLIQTQSHGDALADRLMAIPGVVAAEDVSGAYDAIALAGAGSTRNLLEQIVSKILALPGVTRALPAPLIRSLKGRPETAPAGDPLGSRDRAA